MQRLFKNKYVLGVLGVGILVIFLYKTVPASSSPAEPIVVMPDESLAETPKPAEKKPAAASVPAATVTIQGVTVPVEIRKTAAEVEKGLSGRLSLGADQGMLFLFDKPAIYQFWMPDMHFPIDIVWINNGAIVDISANVSNEFDPAAPKLYRPKKPAQYVLEVNAGYAKAHGWSIGSAVTFKNVK